jgi:hypothetical protein
MPWTITSDVDEFLTSAGPFLRTRAVANTVLLTVTSSLAAHSPGGADLLVGWWRAADGAVAGAFLRTPPRPLVLAGSPADAVTALAATLATDHPLPGIIAHPDDAAVFAAEWSRRTGDTAEPGRHSRLYRLDGLILPSPPPSGAARLATVSDRDLLIAWFEAFRRAIGEDTHGVAVEVDTRIGYGGLTLWEVDGVPVSIAGNTRPTAGMARVAPVYTPVELRGRGYAGAATAAVSRALLDAGVDEILLFTDLANQTSNALYQRLGYVPIEDRVLLAFRRPGEPAKGEPGAVHPHG